MIVHLVGGLRDPDVDAVFLKQIVTSIHDHGAVLAYNWLDASLSRKKQGILVPDWTPYVDDSLEAIKRADIIIADLTHYSFSQGFIIAAALKNKKPILAVSRNRTNDNTAAGITNPLFNYKKYTTTENLSELVDAFIEKNTVHTKDLRFNMFLTRPIFKYLEETSRETGKSRSEIIRGLVKRKAEENRG